MIDRGIEFMQKAAGFVLVVAILVLVLSLLWTTAKAWGEALSRPFGYVTVTGVVVAVGGTESSVAYLNAHGQRSETSGPRVSKTRRGTSPRIGDQIDLYVPEHGGAASSGDVLMTERLDLPKVALFIAVLVGIAALWALFDSRTAAWEPPQGSRAGDEAQRQHSLQRSIDQEIAERVAEQKRRGDRQR
ncbi:MAG: hypothetical protein RLZZ618_3620 [Pseudomonadota bacterium]